MQHSYYLVSTAYSSKRKTRHWYETQLYILCAGIADMTVCAGIADMTVRASVFAG